MHPSATPVPHRVVLWGVVAPLLVGVCVPALGDVAVLWLVCGMITFLLVGSRSGGHATAPVDDDVAALLGPPGTGPATPVRAHRWWDRVAEDPNVAAARAGSWG